MDIKYATKIIGALADGVDPYTGEVLPSNGPYQNPDTVRALFLAIKALEQYETKEQVVKVRPNNAGKSWTSEEDQELIDSFDSGVSVKELSVKHGRTKGAIEARLMRLGKITVKTT